MIGRNDQHRLGTEARYLGLVFFKRGGGRTGKNIT